MGVAQVFGPARRSSVLEAAISGALWLVATLAVAGCTGAVPTPGPFQDARAIAATPDGRVWVVDGGEAAVVVLEGGSPDARLGGAGTGQGAFLDPTDVDPTNGLAVFVADRAAGTVLQFTAEFRLALEVVVPDVDPSRPARQPAGVVRDGNRGQPLAVAAGPDGVLFVLDGGRRHVLQLSSEGDVERVLGAGLLVDPVDLALDDGTLWVADRGRGVVQRFDPFGSDAGSVDAAALGPLVSVDASGPRVVVAGARVGVLDPSRPDVLEVVTPAAVGEVRGAVEVGGRLLILTARDVGDAGVD